jgi:type II secretory pathway pseudopilin PulG
MNRFLLAVLLLLPHRLLAQGETDPAQSLASALAAACRANEPEFENYLTADNAEAFRALPADQRAAVLKRLALSEQSGKPLRSSDDHNHTVLRCTSPEGTAEFRFGEPRTGQNLAFVPVTVNNGENTQFGLVRENGGWRLISLGLVLLDIRQLSPEWAAADLAAREDRAVSDLRDLASAIETYRRAFGKLPDSLAQLGPAPKDQVSPDQADLVDDRLAAGSDDGYRFRYRVVPGAQEGETAFELAAMPDDYGKTGRRSFFVDATGKIHGADRHGELASADDPAIP